MGTSDYVPHSPPIPNEDTGIIIGSYALLEREEQRSISNGI